MGRKEELSTQSTCIRAGKVPTWEKIPIRGHLKEKKKRGQLMAATFIFSYIRAIILNKNIFVT